MSIEIGAAAQPVAPAIELNVARNQQRKRDASRRLNLVLNPAFRVAGFALLALAVWLHNRFLLHEADPSTTLQMALVFGLYPLVSWLALALWYDAHPQLSTFFLGADLFMLVLAIYYSGGERSLLFIVPLFRVIDQTHTTFRRALIFGHAAVAGYLGLMVVLDVFAHHPIDWTGEAVKAGFLYFGALYTALTARAADAAKQRTGEAIRVARASIARLEESERELRRVMNRNELILQSAGEGIVGFDLDARVVFANRRAARTIGLEPAELVGRNGHSLAVHCADDGNVCDGTNCPLENILRSGKEERGVNPGFFRKDGSVVPVEFTSAPMFEEGRLAGAVFSFRDISERQELERELRRAKEAAEGASRAKSTFLANMSHELRTPLNAILGYSEMLEEELREEGHRGLAADAAKVRTAGNHLLGMIGDILDIAKFESGRLQVTPEEIDAAAFAKEVVAANAAKFAAKENRLTLVSEGDGATLVADPALLRRVLEALLDNANKFSSSAETRLVVGRGENGVVFRVEDEGIGMEPAQLERVFEPFETGDASSTKSYSGAGVGLALAQRLVLLMGGRLQVRSGAGKGSIVSLEFPATEVNA
jgi:PAS domain S-box-containing protein